MPSRGLWAVTKKVLMRMERSSSSTDTEAQQPPAGKLCLLLHLFTAVARHQKHSLCLWNEEFPKNGLKFPLRHDHVDSNLKDRCKNGIVKMHGLCRPERIFFLPISSGRWLCRRTCCFHRWILFPVTELKLPLCSCCSFLFLSALPIV